MRNILIILSVLGLFTAEACSAGGYRYRHEHRRFTHSEWRHGYWFHGEHAGRFGWWWPVGGTWYFYTLPTYPYPVEPEVIIEEQMIPQTTVIIQK